MDELDDLLRATFAERERETADGAGFAEAAGLADATRLGYARRTAKRRQMLAVGTVGVLAVGGSSALAFARHGSGSGQPSVAIKVNTMTTGQGGLRTPTGPAPNSGSGSAPDSASGSTPGANPSSNPGSSSNTAEPPQGVTTAQPLPVAGSRAWSSHGLQVRVPEQWKANQEHCGTPTKDTVLIGGGATADCLVNEAPRVTSVRFGTATDPDVLNLVPVHEATVSGKSAVTGTGVLSNGHMVTVIIVPDLDVSVVIKGDEPQIIGQIAATAQIVDADANGCATEVASVEPSGPPVRSGAQTTMVPGTPVKAIVCHYGSSMVTDQAASKNGPILLTNGSTIAADQIAGLTGILNSLPPGQATWQGLAGACAPAARDGYVFRFSYASGPPVDVYLHTSNCDHEGFGNGAVTGLIPKAFVDGTQKYLPDMGFEASGEAMSE